jgi:shikimate kinase
MVTGRRIYIIGFMGSGKSTAGKKLAATLEWQFLDLDIQIERQEGQSIKDIFSSHGEDHFREIESKTLLNLNTSENTVISTGGGTPCYGNNMDYLISTGLVVYLKMTPGQLMSRLERSTRDRPLIKKLNKKELLKFISDKLLEREEYYLKASLIVKGTDLDIKALNYMINERLRGQSFH